MHRWIVLSFTLLAGACTDFDAVTRNVCGNGLLEQGEDCDSSDPNCVRCAVACSAQADCPSADYTCGVDGFCHAPGGELAPPSAPVVFPGEELRVTDIDRDGTGDVVGVSTTSLVVRYGDAAGALSASDSFVTPAQSGPPAFGDLDGDGAIDVTLTTPAGLVTYASRFGTLSPVNIESPISNEMTGRPLDMMHIQGMGPTRFGAFFVESDALVFVLYDLANPNASGFTVPCFGRLGTISATQFDPSSVDIYRASADGAAIEQFVVAFSTTSGVACATAINTATSGYDFTDITPTGMTPFATPPILADVDHDADRCPSLVSSDQGPAQIRFWKGELSGGHCTLRVAPSALPPLEAAPSNSVVVGRIPIEPAIPFVAPDALVMSTGLYAPVIAAQQTPLLYDSPRAIADVAWGDLDRDGDVDGVLVPRAQDDLDVLYRFAEGLALVRFDTAGVATAVTLGDFDGNSWADIAYVESTPAHQELKVAYGTSDRPLPPVHVATFSTVASVAPMGLPGPQDPLSVADDLFVLQPPVGGAQARMSILFGSPQRTLLAFFDPRTDPMRETTLLRAAVVGDFVAGDTPHTDVLVFAEPSRAWRVAGTDNHLDGTLSDGLAVSGLPDADAVFLTWPLGAGRDAVIALDRDAPRAAWIDPWAGASSLTALALDVVGVGLPADLGARSAHAADLDGDGAFELVASFASPTAGAVRVCWTRDGKPERCESLAIPDTTCIDAAPARLGPRTGGDELVVLCRQAGTASALYRVRHDGIAFIATPLVQGVDLRAVRAADVTGDGVDDVIAVQGDRGATSLVVFAQCSSRDMTRCRKTSAATGEEMP